MEYCRICIASTAEEPKIVHNIFEGAEPLADMIYELCDLKVLENDGLPHTVCDRCEQDLKFALNLKRKCLESDEKLRLIVKTESLHRKIYEERVECETPVISYKILYEEVIEQTPPEIEATYILEVEPAKIEVPNINEVGQPESTQDEQSQSRGVIQETPPEIETSYIVEQGGPQAEEPNTNEVGQPESVHTEQPQCRDRENLNLSLVKVPEPSQTTDQQPYPIEQSTEQTQSNQILNSSNEKEPNEPFPCCGCEQAFQTKTELSEHSKAVHKPHRTWNSERPFECSVCYRRYTTHRGFKVHRKNVYQRKNHQCPSCGKRFINQRVLENHERTHTTLKPFPCNFCPKTFRSTSNLLSHVKLHSAIPEHTKHMCTICDKGFSRKSYLKYHNNLVHSEEMPFVCSLCPSKFKAKANLRLHLRTHTQERPYSCDICDKTFMYPTDKKRHVLQHSGLKPFKCQDCDKAFTRKTLLQKHRTNCHEDISPPQASK